MNSLAVARLVRRELLRRPLHLVLLITAATLILLSRSMVAFGFGQELSLIALGGLETIALYAFAVAVLFGAGSVGRDIDSRLLVSILAKPIGRGAYLLGRFLGLVQSFTIGVVPLVVLLGVTLTFSPEGPVGGAEDVEHGALALASLLVLAQAAALAAAVLAISVSFPPALTLVLALLLAGAGLVAEPLRQGMAASGTPVVDLGTRLLALALPPVSLPGEGSEIAFGETVPVPLILTRLCRSLVYAALALVLATWRLGRKDLT